MKEIGISLTFKTVPPILLRRRQALILLRDQQGKFILGTKDHYPDNIVRLVGGGINDGEDSLTGAVRELGEELGIKVDSEKLVELAMIRPTIQLEANEFSQKYPSPIEFETYLYFYQLNDEILHPSDDLDGVVHLTKLQYQQLIENYLELSEDIHPKLGFSWADYGRYYSFVHDIALQEANVLQPW
jgi:8-oxo-dGTP pyrophosphatase MutT (NUDIX family)